MAYKQLTSPGYIGFKSAFYKESFCAKNIVISSVLISGLSTLSCCPAIVIIFSYPICWAHFSIAARASYLNKAYLSARFYTKPDTTSLANYFDSDPKASANLPAREHDILTKLLLGSCNFETSIFIKSLKPFPEILMLAYYNKFSTLSNPSFLVFQFLSFS